MVRTPPSDYLVTDLFYQLLQVARKSTVPCSIAIVDEQGNARLTFSMAGANYQTEAALRLARLVAKTRQASFFANPSEAHRSCNGGLPLFLTNSKFAGAAVILGPSEQYVDHDLANAIRQAGLTTSLSPASKTIGP